MSIAGLYPPLITPFVPGGAVDLGRSNGSPVSCSTAARRCLVALGSTGEPFALSAARVGAIVLQRALDGRGAAIVGAGLEA